MPQTEQTQTDPRPISERLRAAGYGCRYRPNFLYGKREIYDLATGRVVGTFDAQQAVEFLATVEA